MTIAGRKVSSAQVLSEALCTHESGRHQRYIYLHLHFADLLCEGQFKTIDTGPITIVTGKARRVTFVEVRNDINHMIDVAKVVDLVS